MERNLHEFFMQRCLQLARLGEGKVAPNPVVGAVLVHEGQIIGEGYHRVYGQAHAEVNCINSVPPSLQELIPKSTMYVTLEPCAHHGKTPPCADLIVSVNIPRVVIGCVDTFSEVAGRGIQKLEAAGVEVTTGVLETACRHINRRFFTYHEQQRPYIVLKWAQSKDGYIAPDSGLPVAISNKYTNRLVHQWRSHEMAIMVGTQTALTDNPQLTTRLWPGKSPIRLVIDRDLKVPADHHLYNDEAPSVFITAVTGRKKTIVLDFNKDILPPLMAELHAAGIQSVMVEGGAKLLESFIRAGLWDEMRVITGEALLGSGLRAPAVRQAQLQEEQELQGDHIAVYIPAPSST
ncbi:bifunctional diaminohydroxyphosphoribosylaminopyrimidine deaminase/5-amino-6-(5-phosphoribosylamino)uracil reductase RibD [Chitinophaga lutea]|uniref:Riboflavin biosynthesis protein RibD n=1 Tax=Chitinophaga lutea TaxID=2488634 RepID=A0A3N4PMC4_9BACT|nr:bifunctional diaminohydroxyphosphoribosylaminopyrimidine deaminase/5-amino-6-(5-phosphoribosylamino)uracil reductase RibD [Chitinophaga lutea]RPE09346.1 bifunctional diaminohydroxyphosphoribosylaminopyrimidine deaminase/5-amino-6-(5-phosphoribosylamino)uracil reductase RibD [Chitinophaga lutea]